MMGMRAKVLVTTAVVAAICFPMTFVIWPADRLLEGSGLVPILGYGLLAGECLALGAGVAFLAFGYPAVRRLPVSPRLATASYIGIAFLLVSWWPHDHLHQLVERLDFQSLIWGIAALEYFFHGGMMVCGGILSLFFYRVLLQAPVRVPASPAERHQEVTAS
jgi:hypothetical protein